MIVKNESHVIEETLNNIKDYLSYWVISDTGSSDNTKEIITSFFEKHSIPGKLVEHKWEDFGTNRTLALQACFKYRKHFDYIWVFDADDLVVGDFKFPKKMKEDFYSIKYGEGFTYTRSQIFKSSEKWEYVGVLHEYPRCVSKKNPSKGVIEGNYYIDSRRLGARNKDENKYLRDAQVLEKGLIKEPDNTRYMFYLGQSYMDYGNYVKAIEWYTQRAKAGGWFEEVYYSLYRIATCMRSRGDAWSSVEKAFLRAWKYLSSRAEPLYEIGKYYREKQKYDKGYSFLKQASTIPFPETQVLFLFKDVYDYKALDELSICAHYLRKYEESFEIGNKLLRGNLLPEHERIRIERNRDMNIDYILPITTQYPAMKIVKLRQREKKGKNIIFTVTSCKRMDLFTKTINSFLNCCEDYLKIDKWLCVDDNSSQEDREKMKKLYPFFDFVFKTPEQKGHVKSMNIIYSKISEYKYNCHMEDDWAFFEKRNYLAEAIEILESRSELGQLLFNRHYAERSSCRVIGGGRLGYSPSSLRYLTHVHYESNTKEYEDFQNEINGKPNSVYWPHYSLRPSVLKVRVMKEVGDFENITGHFERDYANRYNLKGYKSAFLDTICSYHIGKCTWEKGDNAYSLNDVPQFFPKQEDEWIVVEGKDSIGYDLTYVGEKEIEFLKTLTLSDPRCIGFNSLGFMKHKILEEDKWKEVAYPNFKMYIHKKRFEEQNLKIKNIVINLRRREDRKNQTIEKFEEVGFNNYEFFDAIDGKTLLKTKKIEKMFEGNDFGWRRGVIGCALSHYNLWLNLSQDEDSQFYCIFEDDFSLCPNFQNVYEKASSFMEENTEVDVLFLGYHVFKNQKLEKYSGEGDICFIPCDLDRYIGGFFAYFISKNFANKMLRYIERNGIKHGIDYLIKINPELNVFECSPHIVYSDWVDTLSSKVDSDIQKDFFPLREKEYDLVEIDGIKFKYYPGLDAPGNDIRAVGKIGVNTIAKVAFSEPECLGFNSLGFLKNKIETIETSPWISPEDGLYVKFEEKKIRVKMICNWCNSSTLCKEWNHMSKGSFTWNDLIITSGDEDIDYYVIINKPSGNEKYIPGKTIIFQMEPWCSDPKQNWGVKTWGEWGRPNPDKFLQVRTHDKFVNNAFWQLSWTYSDFKNKPIEKTKGNLISSICSSKYFDPGHIKRIDFMKFIEEKNDPLVSLHIYNTDNTHNFKSYQGPHPPGNKDLGITPYKYYFMAENNLEYNFITEKIWEPLLTESLCFYWGCPNVSDYIDPRAFVLLDLNDFEKSFEIVKDAIRNNLWEERIEIIRREKQKVLEYYGFFPTLERVIKWNSFSSLLPQKIERICFIHSCNLPGVGTKILDEMITSLLNEGMFDLILVNNVGQEIQKEYHKKVKIHQYSSNPSLFELPTIRLISEFSKEYPNVKLLYLHTKGVTSPNSKNISDWKDMMLYFLVNKGENCLDKLEEYDAVGCNYLEKPYPHFSGNFWWANTNYLKDLRIDELSVRHDAEWWVLKNTKKFFVLHNSGINHYQQPYSRMKYEH